MIKKKLKIKVINEALAATLNLKAGAIVEIDCKGGVPINREWRNRLSDSEIDGCVEIVTDKPKTKSKEIS